MTDRSRTDIVQPEMDGIFRQRVAFTILWAASATAAAIAIWLTREVLLLIFAGLLAALALSTATSWVQTKLRLHRGLSLLLVMVSLFAALGLGVWARGSRIAEQVSQLQTDLPIALRQIGDQLGSTVWGRWLLDHWLDRAHLSTAVNYTLPRMGPAIAGTATVLVGLVLVAMMSVYVAAEPESYLHVLHLVIPGTHVQKVDTCIGAAIRMLRYWLLAKLLSMLCIGTWIYLGLLLLGVPLAGTLGVIAAILTFIPNVGPFLSVVPAAALAFAVNPVTGMLTLALFATAHFLEGNIVTPLLERRIATLPPALTLTVQVILAVLTGSLGIIMAAPLTAAALAIIQALQSETHRTVAAVEAEVSQK